MKPFRALCAPGEVLFMRRLPVYLLLDVSGSMHGAPLAAVKNGLHILASGLRQDPYALETAWLSVITFADSARQAVPLTEINAFQPPLLRAQGETRLGEGLELLAQMVDSEVSRNTLQKKGDWKPLVFIMSDGVPTDSLDNGIKALQKRKLGTIVACAAGPAADVGTLKRITDNVVRLDNLDDASVMAFFRWVSASVSTGSARVDTGMETGDILDELPPPPGEVIFI